MRSETIGVTSVEKIANLIYQEFLEATERYGPFHSTHEGYAVIKEELDELWAEIKKKNPDKEHLKREAIQVAAMAMRFLYDLCTD